MTYAKRLLFLFCFLCFATNEGLAQLTRYQTLKPENPIDFSVIDFEGKKHRISDFRGRIVLINFWASWCPPCVSELPSLKSLAETFPNEEFVVLAISKDKDRTKKTAQKLIPETTTQIMPLLFDDSEEGTKLLEIRGLPTTVILDREGRVVGRLRGATIWDHHEVQDLIQAYIEGRTPQPLSWWQRLKKTLFNR